MNPADTPQLIGQSTRYWLGFNEGILVRSSINSIQKPGHLDCLPFATDELAILVVALCLLVALSAGTGCRVPKGESIDLPVDLLSGAVLRSRILPLFAATGVAATHIARPTSGPQPVSRERILRRCSQFNPISHIRGQVISAQTRRTVLNLRSGICPKVSSGRFFYAFLAVCQDSTTASTRQRTFGGTMKAFQIAHHNRILISFRSSSPAAAGEQMGTARAVLPDLTLNLLGRSALEAI